MGLETVTYISDFNQANPDGATDLKSEGDNHIRNIKKGVLNTFPNINGEVTASQSEINPLVGVTARTGGGTILDSLASGTVMVFNQTTAPTGWTKGATHNDKALRVVTGAVGSGGTDAFTTTFSAAKTTASHVLSLAEMPSHTHTLTSRSHNGDACYASPVPTTANPGVGSVCADFVTDSAGSDTGHTHDVTMDLQYVDVIIASKD